MATIEMWEANKELVEEWCDQAKSAILKELVRDGIMEREAADEWAATHTVLLRKKGFFRTISDKWWKHEADHFYFLVAKIHVDEICEDEEVE